MNRGKNVHVWKVQLQEAVKALPEEIMAEIILNGPLCCVHLDTDLKSVHTITSDYVNKFFEWSNIDELITKPHLSWNKQTNKQTKNKAGLDVILSVQGIFDKYQYTLYLQPRSIKYSTITF